MTESERDTLNTKANSIREKIIMGAAQDLQDQLFEYADKTIVDSKTRNVRIKVQIV